MLDNNITVELVELAKSGDTFAKEELYKKTLPLLKYIVKRFVDKGVEYDDLFQIASIGLLKAINNFKMEFGTKFTTYTVPMVIGEIKRYMRDNGAIKVSRSIKQLANKLSKYCDDFFITHERTPNLEEMANYFSVDETEVVLALNSTKMPISIYEQTDDNDDNGMELIERIEGDNPDEKILTKIHFKNIINSLNDNEKKVIVMRYYRDKTQGEIAKDLGVSQVQVSRIESKVLNKMRLIVWLAYFFILKEHITIMKKFYKPNNILECTNEIFYDNYNKGEIDGGKE